MVLLLLLMAFVIGLVIPLQSAVNNSLRQTLGSGSLLAALVSFAVGTLALALTCVVTGQPFATLVGLPRIAWWEWLGGILGAFFRLRLDPAGPAHRLGSDDLPHRGGTSALVPRLRPLRSAGPACAG